LQWVVPGLLVVERKKKIECTSKYIGVFLYGCLQYCSNIRALATDCLFGLFSFSLVGILSSSSPPRGGEFWEMLLYDIKS
jgi:hypothetical protein